MSLMLRLSLGFAVLTQGQPELATPASAYRRRSQEQVQEDMAGLPYSNREKRLQEQQDMSGLPYYEREKRLREFLLNGYDYQVPPTPVRVEMSINFFKMVDLDLKSSLLTFQAWLRLSWYDERLKYNATQWKVNSTLFTVEPNSLENCLVWIPDLELYNGADPLANMFPMKPVQVFPSGFVWWSRPGILKVLCKFEGLENFPLDDLTCHLEFGAWMLDGWTQDILPREKDGGLTYINGDGQVILGTGDSAGGSSTSLTAGSSFQEYSILNIRTWRDEMTYECCPAPWPQVYYRVALRRAQTFYVSKLIVPQISMGVLSWITYFMNPAVGERLGFGVTLLLAVIATDIVAMELMPVCKEILMMNMVSFVCFAFCVFALLETGVVLFLHHVDSPGFVSWFDNKFALICLPCNLVFKGASRRKNEKKGLKRGPSQVWANSDDDFDSVNTPATTSKGTESLSHHGVSPQKSKSLNFGHSQSVASSKLQLEKEQYMHAFYALDADGNGYLTPKEMNQFGRFLLDDAWDDQLIHQWTIEDKSGTLTFEEFTEFCEATIMQNEAITQETMKDKIKNFINILEKRKVRANRKCRKIASRIDWYCGRLVPFIMVLSLAVTMAYDHEVE